MDKDLLQQVIAELKGVNLNKRLRDIQEYIQEKFPDSNCRLGKPEDLLNYATLAFTEEDIDNFFGIINQSYSLGEPFFILNFSIDSKKTVDDLARAFVKSLEPGKDVSIDYRFTVAEIVGELSLFDARIRIWFNEYNTFQSRDGKKRIDEENPLSYGYFECHFLSEKNIILVNVGDFILAKLFRKYLEDNFFKSFRIKPSFFKVKSELIKYKGPRDVVKSTIFLLELMKNELNDSDHKILDYKKLGFENLKSSKVKTIRLGGQNLLESEEVADQVKKEFKLKSVEIRVQWVRPTSVIHSNIMIDLGTAVKIKIREIDNNNYTEDIAIYVWEKMQILLANGVDISSASDIISHYFPGVVSRQLHTWQVMKNNIKGVLISNSKLKLHRDLINSLIDKA